MNEPDYIVVRPASDLPAGFLPDYWDGRWIDLEDLHRRRPAIDVGEAVAIPTGRFEVRDDGAVAEIYEVRP